MIDVTVNLKEVQEIKKKIDMENDRIMRFVPTQTKRVAFKIQRVSKQLIQKKEHIITRSLGRSISVVFNRASNKRCNAKIGTWLEYGGDVEKLPVGSYRHERPIRSGRYFWAQGGGGYLHPAAEFVFNSKEIELTEQKIKYESALDYTSD